MRSLYIPPRIPHVRYSSLADKVIANTITETSMFNGGAGSLYLVHPISRGTVVRAYLTGYVSTGNTQQSTIRMKLSGTTIVESLGTLPSALDAVYFETEFVCTIREIGASGSVITQGRSLIAAAHGVSTSNIRAILSTAPVSVDLSGFPMVDVTYQWASALAENSVTITNAFVQVTSPIL